MARKLVKEQEPLVQHLDQAPTIRTGSMTTEEVNSVMLQEMDETQSLITLQDLGSTQLWTTLEKKVRNTIWEAGTSSQRP